MTLLDQVRQLEWPTGEILTWTYAAAQTLVQLDSRLGVRFSCLLIAVLIIRLLVEFLLERGITHRWRKVVMLQVTVQAPTYLFHTQLARLV